MGLAGVSAVPVSYTHLLGLFFFFQKKGMKVTQAMLVFTAILVVLGALGIL